jgi:hypothetical protein
VIVLPVIVVGVFISQSRQLSFFFFSDFLVSGIFLLEIDNTIQVVLHSLEVRPSFVRDKFPLIGDFIELFAEAVISYIKIAVFESAGVDIAYEFPELGYQCPGITSPAG